MVIHDQVDWRSLEDSLALDVSLVESVFHGLSKEYDKRQLERERRLSGHQPNSTDKNQNNNDEEEHHHINMNQLDETMFAKADVLLALENAGGYLDKRPWLRVLHTRLACVSFEKEGASLQGFVRHRQRDRTVCLRDVRRRLEVIYADAKLSMEVEEKHKRFLAQARAVSPWCVRDPKCLHPSPARQLYGVHVLPRRPVTEEELQEQRDCVASHARAVVNAAVGVVMDKLLAPYARPKTSASTGRTARRALRSEEASRISSTQRQARAKREQAERDAQLRALRLELLAPTADLASLHKTDGAEVETKKKKKDEIAHVMLQLALVEAQGDGRLARTLLDHLIVQSGFRRAAEQAKRLGITSQTWEVVKLWRDLYRTSTMQALGNM
ncbi:WD repeat-containing protein 74 [Phytophthora cinnamomi]|uniref:WD repeat-containing protein 74 n=1 Tax=Phytophthora cinnamomi TaxID=4785 RepID=UPI00355A6CE4|nr:WD repeat-containing protein 74 [Phytophthora cinnamomi]